MGVLEGKIAVVTGASRGIGYHAALGYAREGAHVIAVARTVGGLEELDDEIKAFGGSATLVPVDLKDGEAIDRLGAAIYERWGKLDILLANAGTMGVVTPLSHMDVKTFDEIMAVNVTANWRLIRSLEPLLKQSDAARAVFLTSGAVHKNRPFVGPYTASKAALEAMVKTWANESAHTSMRINLVDPATVRTAMRARYAPGEDPKTVPLPQTIVPALVKLASVETSENGQIYLCAEGRFAD
jgi:NAD(P)-dependent dehydrogenase (short-subunit alcohol dehydrogenase family)